MKYYVNATKQALTFSGICNSMHHKPQGGKECVGAWYIYYVHVPQKPWTGLPNRTSKLQWYTWQGWMLELGYTSSKPSKLGFFSLSLKLFCQTPYLQHCTFHVQSHILSCEFAHSFPRHYYLVHQSRAESCLRCLSSSKACWGAFLRSKCKIY